MTTSWLTFWEREHSAFAPGERTRQEAEQLARRILEQLGLSSGATVLDWGCGWALGTSVYDRLGVNVLLHDQSRLYAQAATERFSDNEGVEVLSEEELKNLTPHSVDALVVFSVLQYLTDRERQRLFALAARVLAPSGQLVLGDLLPAGGNFLQDLKDFLPRSLRPHRAVDRLWASVRLLGGDYLRLRRELGLRSFTEEELTAELLSAGLTGAALAENLGPNRGRFSWIASRRPAGDSVPNAPGVGSD